MSTADLELLCTELMMRKIIQDGLESFFSLVYHKEDYVTTHPQKKFTSAFNNIVLCNFSVV